MRQTLKGIGALTEGQGGRDVWVSYSADMLLRAVARGETEGVTTTRERKISSVVSYSKQTELAGFETRRGALT